MDHTPPRTSLAPDWISLNAEESEDLDEPPELPQKFQRTSIRRPHDQSSLLTKAIMGEPDDESIDEPHHSILTTSHRRRSLTSNVSMASTADLTSDTGMTSPCRTNTPSPPIPEMTALRLNPDVAESKVTPVVHNASTIPPAQAPKKRCIQFACAKPPAQTSTGPQAQPMVKAPSAQEAPRRPCIKFACPARPASTQNTPPSRPDAPITREPLAPKPESPSTPKKSSALTTAIQTASRPPTIRRLSNKSAMARPKFLRANSKDLVKDGSQFHEFASGMSREEDWIRQGNNVAASKLTIHDTLTKENHFRRLGAEAEEEAEMEEEEEAEAALDEDEDEDDDDDVDEDEDDDEDEDEDDEDEDEELYDEDSDGYHTDEETGFAESDDDDDEEDENMILWTPSHATVRQASVIAPVRRSSLNELQSDSSAVSHASQRSVRRTRPRRIKEESDAPDLPDSTDFVCGTLDEDRPLEEAYLSCLAARRNGNLRVIPQDIDPSFPASDPEGEDEDVYNPVHHESDDDVWVQGKMEDLHHEDRSRRRRKSEQASPRKYRSPPPRRHHSPPPPKARGRSPKPLFGRHSPRRIRSPAPKAMTTPLQTPRQGPHMQLRLAGRPGMTQTKSLPRAGAFFAPMKSRAPKHHHESDCHLRGAIDIVKGLERKRQRRKEKFFQKYCNRARRGQIPERKPQPGRGAERMKELGLLMAGKKDQGNYVLSV